MGSCIVAQMLPDMLSWEAIAAALSKHASTCRCCLGSVSFEHCSAPGKGCKMRPGIELQGRSVAILFSNQDLQLLHNAWQDVHEPQYTGAELVLAFCFGSEAVHVLRKLAATKHLIESLCVMELSSSTWMSFDQFLLIAWQCQN